MQARNVGKLNEKVDNSSEQIISKNNLVKFLTISFFKKKKENQTDIKNRIK